MTIPTNTGVSVRAEGICLRAGSTVILDEVSIAADPGEFVALLGPSGAGKSSLLKVIGGHVVPDRGTVQFGDRDVTQTAADGRPSITVFQNHGLFPHMTVFENVAFGLKVAGRSHRQATARVEEMLNLVGLAGKGDRHVATLSGGESQRVATARALAVAPSVILMDEPLAALDRQIKERLQLDLKNLLGTLGVTVFYVTHDQEEALMLADQVVVMTRGRVEQAGDPVTLYREPSSVEVARFLGSANVVPAVPVAPGEVTVNGVRFESRGFVRHGGPVRLAVRQENVVLGPPVPGALQGSVTYVHFKGSFTRYGLTLRGDREVELSAQAPGTPSYEVGELVSVDLRDGFLCPLSRSSHELPIETELGTMR